MGQDNSHINIITLLLLLCFSQNRYHQST